MLFNYTYSEYIIGPYIIQLDRWKSTRLKSCRDENARLEPPWWAGAGRGSCFVTSDLSYGTKAGERKKSEENKWDGGKKKDGTRTSTKKQSYGVKRRKSSCPFFHVLLLLNVGGMFFLANNTRRVEKQKQTNLLGV